MEFDGDDTAGTPQHNRAVMTEKQVEEWNASSLRREFIDRLEDARSSLEGALDLLDDLAVYELTGGIVAELEPILVDLEQFRSKVRRAS